MNIYFKTEGVFDYVVEKTVKLIVPNFLIVEIFIPWFFIL